MWPGVRRMERSVLLEGVGIHCTRARPCLAGSRGAASCHWSWGAGDRQDTRGHLGTGVAGEFTAEGEGGCGNVVVALALPFILFTPSVGKNVMETVR